MDTMKKRGAREKKRWQGSEKGQSLVEFAASAVVLMIIVAGVLDIGRAFMIFVAPIPIRRFVLSPSATITPEFTR